MKDDKSGPCCLPFDPSKWDDKATIWDHKPFIKDTIPQFLHMPFPPMLARKMARMWKMAQEANAAPDLDDFLFLAYDPSPWRSELFLAVTKEVPGAKNTTLTGEYLSKVFDGPYNAVPRWIKEMDPYVKSHGRRLKRYLFYFTTCPKCARLYGHNYVVAFAEVEQ
jgi:Bacterial hydrolase